MKSVDKLIFMLDDNIARLERSISKLKEINSSFANDTASQKKDDIQ